jgi:hypothetical protein
MTQTGIPCRHILRVSTQLDLEQLPEQLFPIRWCKDPSDECLSEQYTTFYSVQLSQHNASTTEESYTPMQHEDFQLFMLNKTMRKVERFAKYNPGTAKALHGEINKILDTTTVTTDTAESSSSQIRNPLVVSTKGSKKNTLKKGEKTAQKSGTTVRKITCRTCGQQGHTSRSKKCPGIPVSDSEETVDGEQVSLSNPADLQGNIMIVF